MDNDKNNVIAAVREIDRLYGLLETEQAAFVRNHAKILRLQKTISAMVLKIMEENPNIFIAC